MRTAPRILPSPSSDARPVGRRCRVWALLILLPVAGLVAACGGGDDRTLTGQVRIDGSSTVYPVAEAVAEEFQIENRRVRVTVGISGSGGGFARFCAGETDLSNASREMTDEERAACREAGVRFVELPVAWDGLSVAVNPENDFVECLTAEELRRIWEPGSDVRTWRDVRPEFPDREIQLYGPGTDSGTFDYFTSAIVGESGASRPDYQASEDDNVLVQGVAGDRYALGYFGYAYVAENRERLRVVGVDGGSGCVEPSEETIADQSYEPLSRELFVYLNESSLERPEVETYARFFMDNARDLVPPTGYIPLSIEAYDRNLERIERALEAAGGEEDEEGAGPGERPGDA